MSDFSQELKEHAKSRRDIAEAQLDIWRAVKKGWPEFVVKPPSQELTPGTCDLLTRQQIDMGVHAFVLACNLSGGSVGDVQIYDLLTAYLQDHVARTAINEAVTEASRPLVKAC
ncbi:hypothetical protein SAMN05446927_4265 [Caballeronia arationis]|uniref:Uncharacterized protein n=1 Tax=Caballeronia arationis TaxID=1777142 RepID=A0A7Z7N3L9_9BURK|nr:hypothetical protein [Caballeronia arationis]SOE81011.1 hypothetical protein SAMN05446927_4265 [Caballeronia arationis]